MKGPLNLYDTVIYTDADELVVRDPVLYPDLGTFPKQKTFDYASCAGLSSVHTRSERFTYMGLARSNTPVCIFVRRLRVTQIAPQIQPREAALCWLG
jgi:hypothetical protein